MEASTTSTGRRLGAALGLAILYLSALPLLAPTPSGAATPGNLGTNLAPITWYEGTVPFTDLVRQAGDWIPQQAGRPFGEGDPIALRRDGWPARLKAGQSADIPLAERSYPAGTYRVSWRGSGRFTIFDGTSPGGRRAFSGRNGTGTVTLDGETLAMLSITATSRRDPLRSIRVLVPGARPGSLFRSRYLRSLAPYRVLRFMDWQRTNGTFADPVPAQTCRNRVTPGLYSQGTRRGASVETMVALANALDASPWFTIPHTASADWIRCHATIVARRLDRGLVPRYEFSNETWNPAFVQFHSLTAAGERAGLGDGDSYLGLQQIVARRHLRAMAQVTVAFREVAGKRRPRRVIRVMSGQAANPFVLDSRLSFESASRSVDEVAIAPYLGIPESEGSPFDPAVAESLATLDTPAVLALMASALSGEVTDWIEGNLEVATAYDRPLVAYEGGQHLAGDTANDSLTDLFTATNRSPGIGTLYDAYLATWRTLTGNALFVHFSDSGPYSRFGSWGAIESPDLPLATPKYESLLRFRAGPGAGVLRSVKVGR